MSIESQSAPLFKKQIEVFYKKLRLHIPYMPEKSFYPAPKETFYNHCGLFNTHKFPDKLLVPISNLPRRKQVERRRIITNMLVNARLPS